MKPFLWKGIGCCAPATKRFWPDVLHSAGSAQDIANCWVWGSRGIPPPTTPLKSSEHTLGSSWNLTAAKKKKKKNAFSKPSHCYIAEMEFCCCCCLGWGRESEADNALWALLFVTKASQTPASSRAGNKRGSPSSSSPQQQLVPLRGVDTHFPGSSGSQESHPDNGFSFSSSTNNASHLPPPQPPHLSTHCLLYAFLYLYICINVHNGMSYLGIRTSQPVCRDLCPSESRGFVRAGWTEKLPLMGSN